MSATPKSSEADRLAALADDANMRAARAASARYADQEASVRAAMLGGKPPPALVRRIESAARAVDAPMRRADQHDDIELASVLPDVRDHGPPPGAAHRVDRVRADLPSESIGYTFADAMVAPLSTKYLIKHAIDLGGVAIFFGDSGTLKSFVALDMALHVASGQWWCGLRTVQGAVLIVLGEGVAGYKRRLQAWAKFYGIDPATVAAYVWPQPLDLSVSPDELTGVIAAAERGLGEPIMLVLVDTYSTNLGDADEQSNSDAARVLGNVRSAAGPSRAVAFVHHVGHGAKDRERGAYQLRANAEARFLVERDADSDIVTVSNVKAKEGAELPPMRFEKVVVDLGMDADGDSVTSLVVEPTTKVPAPKSADSGSVPGKYLTALDVLWRLSGTGQYVKAADWRDELVKVGIIAKGSDETQRRMAQRIARDLSTAKLVNVYGRGPATSYSPRSTAATP